MTEEASHRDEALAGIPKGRVSTMELKLTYRFRPMAIAAILIWGSACAPQLTAASPPSEWERSETRIVQPLQLPSSAKVGQPVRVEMVGSGGDSCFHADGVEVEVDEAARVVRLRAFAKRPGGKTPPTCAPMVTELPMTAVFTPKSAGVYRVEARGWDQAAGQEVARTAEVLVEE
jgi:hypothetical protein